MNMLWGLIRSARPRDWVKNGIVIAAWIDAGLPMHTSAFITCVASFVLLSAVSSAIYLLNDVVDRERDLQHPEKRFRPIASGQVPVPVAVGTAIFLAAAALAGAFLFDVVTGGLFSAYLSLQLLYLFWLKHVAFIESILIASGFVLRLMAGTAALQAPISPWLNISCFFTLLFMILQKRQYEIRHLDDKANLYRPVLKEYNAAMLKDMVPVFTACAIVFYAIYSVLNPLTPLLAVTIPFLAFGMLRYRHVAEQPEMDASGQKIFTLDQPTIYNFVLWIALAVLLILLSRR